MVALYGIPVNEKNSLDEFYNFDLEQWGIERQEDETIQEYINRVKTIGETKDIGTQDISIKGAEEFNNLVNISNMDQSTYYFSFSNEQTLALPLSKEEYYLPEIGINPLLEPCASMLGILPLDDPFNIGLTWRENDGLVNTISMKGPILGCEDKIIFFNNNPQKGVWNYMGKINSCDHGDLMGHTQNSYEEQERLKIFFLELVELLNSLE